MRVAIIHDWLVTYAGAEKVLEQLCKIYPEADIFSVVDYLSDDQRKFILNKRANTTFIQKLPFAKKKYRSYLPLMPLAIEQLDLSPYDLVISSSYAVAKGVITGPEQLHISYVHSPMRYAWDMQHQYLKESGLTKGLKSWIVRYLLHKIRIWDTRTANGVDYFIANSKYISKRINKVYRRKSKVIYPPVYIDEFTLNTNKKDFYVTASRMVPYKKMDLIVKAFTKMADKKLIVIGEGPDFKKIQKQCGKNVQLVGYQTNEKLKKYMREAKCFVFAAREDFGIVPVEAQACGTPVVAFGKGGALETIKDIDKVPEAPTGVFFYEQTIESIIHAIEKFEKNHSKFNAEICRLNAEKFSTQIFRQEMTNFIEEKVEDFFERTN
jgi:glycosyltransferase involved in cell wall biosynthesis